MNKSIRTSKVAIVHEWMVHFSGGVERVAAELAETFPGAVHFTLVHDPSALIGTPLEHLDVRTSFLQKIPGSSRSYRRLLPLMPLAIERHNLAKFDLIISLSHAVAKGVLTEPHQTHICYLQARNLKYAYEDRRLYGSGRFKKLVEDALLSHLRVWDSVASNRPDVTIANSEYVRRWHEHRHGVTSEVIYPPVDVEYFKSAGAGVSTASEFGLSSDYYITCGRFESYKRFDLLVEAFRGSGRKLVLVGDGSEMTRLHEIAAGSLDIKFTGRLDRQTMRDLLHRAKAFVFAGREDFGIALVEAQAAGLPLIAYGAGGAEEILGPESDGLGVQFFDQSVDSVRSALDQFDRMEFVRSEIVKSAEQFNSKRFHRQFTEAVDRALKAGRPEC